jgi:hypothetical protein
VSSAATTSFQRGHVAGWKSEDAMTRVHLVTRRYQGVRVMKLTVYGSKRESELANVLSL